eukprot:CAMPEP_0174878856 /NCGR_PEP_ID=MMETSP1114-20130205/82968_1 /TAXON_ID=312471 /ORGANISM="Neobodo designis, Strain CCAP 1951/1" /LENGTH=444 /DNA_ID=CAMNT_0016114245 /DNA_START=53 /DNA_END=1388 /DNA_ORIENTATION=-
MAVVESALTRLHVIAAANTDAYNTNREEMDTRARNVADGVIRRYDRSRGDTEPQTAFHSQQLPTFGLTRFIGPLRKSTAPGVGCLSSQVTDADEFEAIAMMAASLVSNSFCTLLESAAVNFSSSMTVVESALTRLHVIAAANTDAYNNKGDEIETRARNVTDGVIRRYDRSCGDTEPQTVFHSQQLPNFGLTRFIGPLRKSTVRGVGCLSSQVTDADEFEAIAMMAASLVLRHEDATGLPLTSLMLHRLFLAALLVAAKAHHDVPPTTPAFARATGMDPAEMGRLEVTLCVHLDFRLHVGAVHIATALGVLMPPETTSLRDFATPAADPSTPKSRCSPSAQFLQCPTLLPLCADQERPQASGGDATPSNSRSMEHLSSTSGQMRPRSMLLDSVEHFIARATPVLAASHAQTERGHDEMANAMRLTATMGIFSWSDGTFDAFAAL